MKTKMRTRGGENTVWQRLNLHNGGDTVSKSSGFIGEEYFRFGGGR